MKTFLPLFFPLLLLSCAPNSPDPEALRQEIREAEAAFAQMARDSGVPAAFLHFAAEEAVLNRNDRLIRGREEMEAYFNASTLQDVSLEWQPEFVDVSASGDLAYTWGPYTFSARDSSGRPLTADGIFHTVWKRQANGEWRFVYD